MVEMEDRNTALKKACWGFGLVLIWSCVSWLTAQVADRLFNTQAPLTPSLRVGLLCFQNMIAYLFYATSYYYLVEQAKPVLALKPRCIVAHVWLGTGLSFISMLICLVSAPALYYSATRFHNLQLFEWVWAIGYFLGAAAFEEIFFRGVLQNFFALFLRPALATLLQVTLFVLIHDSFPPTPGAFLWRVANLAVLGLLATLLAKKSPYLILPIVFHASQNLFYSLPKGLEGYGFPVEGMWNLGHMVNWEYLPIINGVYILGFWYFYGWNGTGRKARPKNGVESPSCDAPGYHVPANAPHPKNNAVDSVTPHG